MSNINLITLKSAPFKKKKSIRILVNNIDLNLHYQGPDSWAADRIVPLIIQKHLTVTRW